MENRTTSEAQPVPYTTPIAIAKVFQVPFEHSSQFKGRGPFMSMLKQTLKEYVRTGRHHHRIVLYGLGGVGKTRIAIEYCYESQLEDEYKYVFWINGDDRDRLLSGFRKIAERIKILSNIDGQPPEKTAKMVLEWFRIHSDWLLIIDNLNDHSVIDGYLPTSTAGQGDLIITTRNAHTHLIPAQAIEVPPINTDDAIDLLLEKAGMDVTIEPEIQPEAERIVYELGNLPLAIEIAAAHIDNSGNIDSYLNVFHETTLSLPQDINDKSERTIATLFAVSLPSLRAKENSLELMHLLAFLETDEVLVEFLAAGASVLGEKWHAILSDESALQECLDVPKSFSLVQVRERPQNRSSASYSKNNST